MAKRKKHNFITMSGLAEASGERYSTIKFYTEQGLLSYEQKAKRMIRRYDEPASLKKLKEIQRLKNERLSIEEIKKHFRR